MMKRFLSLALGALLLLTAGTAFAAPYTFPDAGVRLDAGNDWTLLTPEGLAKDPAAAAQTGLDAEALRATYATLHVLFEALLPGGERVSLSVVATPETAAWDAAERMAEADLDAFLAAYSQPPYANTAWADTPVGWLQSEYTVDVDGAAQPHALLATVHAGKLYTLTATQQGGSVAALREANEAVSAALVFLSPKEDSPFGNEDDTPPLPAAIADDGVVTPVELVGFTGVTLLDDTTVTIQSIPGADVIVKTPNDTLRHKVGEDGRVSYTVSTRREVVYDYTISVKASGRKTSELSYTIRRRMTDDALQAAYMKSARTLESIGYKAIVASPKAHANTPMVFRGKCAAFMDVDGTPYMLVYTAGLDGAGQNPVWVMLKTAIPLAVGEVRTVYGELQGGTLPYIWPDGTTEDVPVLICHSLVE